LASAPEAALYVLSNDALDSFGININRDPLGAPSAPPLESELVVPATLDVALGHERTDNRAVLQCDEESAQVRMRGNQASGECVGELSPVRARQRGQFRALGRKLKGGAAIWGRGTPSRARMTQ
jgi:hypothetical protein